MKTCEKDNYEKFITPDKHNCGSNAKFHENYPLHSVNKVTVEEWQIKEHECGYAVEPDEAE